MGGEHYKNYRQYIKYGGLPPLVESVGLTIDEQKIVSGGDFGIFLLKNEPILLFTPFNFVIRPIPR